MFMWDSRERKTRGVLLWNRHKAVNTITHKNRTVAEQKHKHAGTNVSSKEVSE